MNLVHTRVKVTVFTISAESSDAGIGSHCIEAMPLVDVDIFAHTGVQENSQYGRWTCGMRRSKGKHIEGLVIGQVWVSPAR